MVSIPSRKLILGSALILLWMGVIINDDVRKEPQVYIAIAQLSQQWVRDPEQDCYSRQENDQE